jgi:diguanylate cyclase (GGDEF)-like protein
MHSLEAISMSAVLMLAIFIDVLRFPMLRQDRGSRFFGKLMAVFWLYLLLDVLVCLARKGIVSFPPYGIRIVWTLRFLSVPCLLAMWMHSNALNVIDDEPLVNRLTAIHLLPLFLLVAVALADIPRQRFYPVDPGLVGFAPNAGTYAVLAVSFFFCFAMVMPTLAHRRELPGSLLFVSLLLPSMFCFALAVYAIDRSSLLFTVVNAFAMMLSYVVGQRDSIRTDRLTGLPTYSLLKRKLIRIFKERSPHAIILLDLENFRYFNARYGTSSGDLMLVSFARYLKSLVRVNEIYRFSDNQFCFCISGEQPSTADSLIRTIKERLDRSWDLEGTSVYVQANMAMVRIPRDASSLEELKQATDRLLLQLKTVRTRTLLVYDREASMRYQRDLDMLTALRDSVRKQGQVKVHYQPIVDLATRKMVSAEALMRIDDASLGFLQPDRFIPLAEQSNLIVPLTRILLADVCRFVKRLAGMDLSSFHVSVNLSGEEFSSRIGGKSLSDIVTGEGVDPKSISFEMTESVMLKSPEAVAETMQEWSRKQFVFSLDDFGSGYSNLQALMQLPYTYVKLDRSVIQGATSDPLMLRLLTEMLHEMGKCVIAEGVETEEQLRMVESIGIEQVQGFFFSKPLDEDAFLALVRSKTVW